MFCFFLLISTKATQRLPKQLESVGQCMAQLGADKVGGRVWPPPKRMPVNTRITLPKTNMTMENPPFEDVFPIEHGGFSNVMLVFRGVITLSVGDPNLNLQFYHWHPGKGPHPRYPSNLVLSLQRNFVEHKGALSVLSCHCTMCFFFQRYHRF